MSNKVTYVTDEDLDQMLSSGSFLTIGRPPKFDMDSFIFSEEGQPWPRLTGEANFKEP